MAKTNGNGDMPNAHLHQLFVDELRDILGAERQLQKAFDQHSVQTEGHIERLKEVFASLGMSARGKKCKAMEGLLNEADEIIEDFQDSPDILDAALISAAQKVEHYEIASYGCLATYADLMNHREAKKLLGKTLGEEKETDELLTKIAMQEANV